MPEGTHKTRDDRFSRKVGSISASGIRRFFELISNMDGCISLGVGEPDFVTPERYMKAAFDSAMAGETHYTSNYGLAELARRPPIICNVSTAFDTILSARSHYVGVSEALLLATTPPRSGDELLCADPTIRLPAV